MYTPIRKILIYSGLVAALFNPACSGGSNGGNGNTAGMGGSPAEDSGSAGGFAGMAGMSGLEDAMVDAMQPDAGNDSSMGTPDATVPDASKPKKTITITDCVTNPVHAYNFDCEATRENGESSDTCTWTYGGVEFGGNDCDAVSKELYDSGVAREVMVSVNGEDATDAMNFNDSYETPGIDCAVAGANVGGALAGTCVKDASDVNGNPLLYASVKGNLEFADGTPMSMSITSFGSFGTDQFLEKVQAYTVTITSCEDANSNGEIGSSEVNCTEVELTGDVIQP